MAKRRVRRTARGAYKMTSRRKAALRKAQIASARKRRGRRRAAVAGAVGVGAIVGTGVYRHKKSGSSLSLVKGKSVNGNPMKRGIRGTTVRGKGVGTTSLIASTRNKKIGIVYSHKSLAFAKSQALGKKTSTRIPYRPPQKFVRGYTSTSHQPKGVLKNTGGTPTSKAVKAPLAALPRQYVLGSKVEDQLYWMREERRMRRG